ncbi:MAG: reverse transcriptase domain-containing protein [Candidatus Pacebacteria bacterium]|nr:reverse transcriptase domain-containing protein [Candidatus Paceibacterota bacterium]
MQKRTTSTRIATATTTTTTAAAHKQQSWANTHTAFAVLSGTALLEEQTPNTYAEALASVDAAKWKEAMKVEYEGCEGQSTWVVVPRARLPKHTNIIPVKWVYKIKVNEKGEVSKYKARITPKGFKQKAGVDYFEVYANTGKYKTLRVMLSIAAARDLELRQLDVPQAFTQAPLDEDVYMEMPPGYEQSGMVCHLKKSLYGLKQSPRNWYLLASGFIVRHLGFRATVSDPCIFWRTSRTGQLIVLFLFVDDIQVAFDRQDADEWRECHAALTKRFNITDLCESKYMLGMKITRDRRARTITLDQELYVTKALEKFGLDHCRVHTTPGVSNRHEDAKESAATDTDAESGDSATLTQSDAKLYQEKVGTLLYAAISTRPDISFAVNKLTQHMQAPTMRDMKACDRVFRYLAGTRTMGLLYGRRRETRPLQQKQKQQNRDDDNNDNDDNSSHVEIYADADWAGDRADRKSITGWIATIGGDPVSWASKKQKVVSQSTCEAELYAEAAAINEGKWLTDLLVELGVTKANSAQGRPTIYGDNQSTQALTKNGIKSERTKHVAIKYAYVYDEVAEKRVNLVWIPTTEQVADILTKALPKAQHQALMHRIMVRCSESENKNENKSE